MGWEGLSEGGRPFRRRLGESMVSALRQSLRGQLSRGDKPRIKGYCLPVHEQDGQEREIHKHGRNPSSKTEARAICMGKAKEKKKTT